MIACESPPELMNMMRAASSPMEPLNKNILLAGEVIAEKWKIGEKIGEGTFSQIYSAYSIESRDKVAVKVEAPSSLKPVLEWESLILKSLQDCPYVCRYYYHGKHGDSTVLVMELLGDSMSMLRMSPDSIHGVPLAKAVVVGLEMLDCIEAFHRHGYVHRDIKASNFALSAVSERNPMKQQRYYIIDFGLSRQHLGEDRQVLPARQVAEFRGTSMYASLSSHHRQELGPKDDLWSWFYLVMDFLRGELPWAADAQLKNRQTVLCLKEHYTEARPSLLVEGLPGAAQLLELMEYLQSLRYEDFPDYKRIRKQLQAVGESSLVAENSDSGDDETSAAKKEAKAVADVAHFDWDALESKRERALWWVEKAEEFKDSDSVSDLLLDVAKRYETFFDSDGLSFDEQMRVQNAVYRIEKKSRVRTSFFAPPPIQSFVKRRQSEQKLRWDALRKRRERDYQVRQSLDIKKETHQVQSVPSHGLNDGDATFESAAKNGSIRPVKSDSSMEVSDAEKVETFTSKHTYPLTDVPPTASTPHRPPPHVMSASMEASMQQWGRSSHGRDSLPPPPLRPTSSPRYALPPSLPPHLAGRLSSHKSISSPKQTYVSNGKYHGISNQPPPSSPRNMIPEQNIYVSSRRYDVVVETRDEHMHGYHKSQHPDSHGSSMRHYKSDTREDRGYAAQRMSVPERHYDSPKETREDRGYSTYSRPQDNRSDVREDRGYSSYQRIQKSPRESVKGYYTSSIEIKEDRGYGHQQPPKPQTSRRESHIEYSKDEGYGQRGIERYYEAKRPRSRSRSLRREVSRSRRRSYSRSSSRSRSWSYSCSPSRSPSPPSHSHYRSRDYAVQSDMMRAKRKYSRRHRSRLCSSSSSRSRSSSRSFSTSPPAKRYRRRSIDQSYPRSSHRHASHVAEYREQSTSYVKEYPTVKSYSKKYVQDYPKEYVKEYPQECAKDYTKEYYTKKERRHSRSRDSRYERSASSERHQSHSRNYSRDGRSWGMDIRLEGAANPEKHRRSSRWQPRS